MNKSFLTAAFLFCLLLFSYQRSFAQWVQSNGPEGGTIYSIYDGGTYLLAGGAGGMFRSIDYGITWSKWNSGLSDDCIVCSIRKQGSTIFAGTMWYGIYQSDDDGATWTAGGNGIPLFAWFVTDIVSVGGTMFCNAEYELFASTDAGASWEASTTIPTHGNLRSLVVDGTTIYASTIYSDSLFVSTDQGASWAVLLANVPASTSFVFAVQGNTIFVGTPETGMFLTKDKGTTWTQINNGLTDSSVYALVKIGSVLYVSTTQGYLFTSTDAGAHWNSISNGLGLHHLVYSITKSGSILLLGTNAGVSRTANDGAAWTENNSGLLNSSCSSFTKLGTDVFVGTHGGVFKSTDNGLNWKSMNTGLEDSRIVMLVTEGNTLYAATAGDGVFISTNGGVSWNPSGAGQVGPDMTFLTVDGANVYAGTYGEGFWRSTDHGATWKDLSGSSLAGMQILSIGVNGGRIFVATDGSLFISSNQGTTWTQNSSWPTYSYGVSNFLFVGGDMYVGNNPSGIGRSTNNGQDWTQVTTGLPAWADIYWLQAGGSNIFCAGTAGVYVSTDRGDDWQDCGTNLPFLVTINSLQVISTQSGTMLLAATDGAGVWRRLLGEMVTVNSPDKKTSPSSLTLDQNHPNPFHSNTTISFSIPSGSFVSLRIYDVLGNEVAALVSEEMPAGNYSRQWDAAGLRNGVYYYRIKAGNFSQMKKMVVMK